MGYLCLDCLEEYDGNLLKLESSDGYNYICPKSSCGDTSLVEVDDLILPVIKLLNSKGYITKYCCSGHSYKAGCGCNTYIAFYEEYVPDVLPKGFYVEDDKWYEENYPNSMRVNDSIAIRKYYDKNLDEYDLQIELCKTMIDLIKWAKKLETIE